MSHLEPPGFEDFSFSGSKRTSGSLANVAEFIDPQYTDKRYGTMQLGFMTPEPSPTDDTHRRESFALSKSFSGSSAASSFMSHSGCRTPSLSTPGSSASTSRRQSMLLPESQQIYLSATPSSPSHRPQRLQKAAATDQCLLKEYSPGSYIASTETVSLIMDGAAACMVADNYAGRPPMQWQSYDPQSDTSSFYGSAAQSAQIDESTSWGRDLAAEFNSPAAARASHNLGFNQPLFCLAQPTLFGSTVPQPDAEMYDAVGNSNPNTPSLAPPFEDADVGFADEDIESDSATVGPPYVSDMPIRQPVDDPWPHLKGSRITLLETYTSSPPSDDDLKCNQAASSIPKSRNRRQKQRLRATFNIERKEPISKSKSHRCPYPDANGIDPCNYACNRPEHLRRHEQSKHMYDRTEMHPCAFAGCINRQTGQHREILARLDNLKAHYTKTHFRYGSSEKGGKNGRKSMKEAHEMGLNVYDSRWTLLLEGKMNLNQEIKDFLHVWKMLGYSILETRDTKVKDVVPDWQGPEDERLQKYDPRWRALWDGTLTLDKAMNVGKDMKESEAQGLLGVTMSETEAMGIKHLDPRWTGLLSGRMSVEQSEKLGVKQKNPLWTNLIDRRRAR